VLQPLLSSTCNVTGGVLDASDVIIPSLMRYQDTADEAGTSTGEVMTSHTRRETRSEPGLAHSRGGRNQAVGLFASARRVHILAHVEHRHF
jgi:hypothetical protein